MNKVELIEAIASKTGLTKKDVENTLNNFTNIVTNTLKKGEKVILTGFGQFEVIKTKARIGVNPRNLSKKINIPSILAPKFRAGKTFKDAIKR